MKKYTFKSGVIWEDNPWEIELDGSFEAQYFTQCKHCYPDPTQEGTFICPAFVVVRNEGGHNSTGVCLDCILEAAKTIDRTPILRSGSATEGRQEAKQ